MIRNRPQPHYSTPFYQGLPCLPYQIELDFVPDLIRLSLLPVRHVEPLTKDVLTIIDDIIEDLPTDEELAFYEKQDSSFQLIFVVINCVFREFVDGVPQLTPYAISLIPASKRGRVEVSKTGFVRATRGAILFETGAAYLGLDPFTGEWELFSQADLIAEMGAKGAFTDEMGLVYDYFFLRTNAEKSEICQPVLGMPESRLRRYLRHRSKLLYTPFDSLTSRQVWGLENGLELFAFHELIRKKVPLPTPQALIFNDGSWQPSLYHAWEAFGDNENSDLVSEVDFYYPDKRIAVFCDGATHNRFKVRERDARINSVLEQLDITPVRITSRQILADVESALIPVTRLL